MLRVAGEWCTCNPPSCSSEWDAGGSCNITISPTQAKLIATVPAKSTVAWILYFAAEHDIPWHVSVFPGSLRVQVVSSSWRERPALLMLMQQWLLFPTDRIDSKYCVLRVAAWAQSHLGKSKQHEASWNDTKLGSISNSVTDTKNETHHGMFHFFLVGFKFTILPLFHGVSYLYHWSWHSNSPCFLQM